MAGLGRRTFQAGEVLTASNVMAYLQDQAVMNFAGSAARGSAIGTAVSEGMTSFLEDTNRLEVYVGTAWNPIAYKFEADDLTRVGLIPVIPTGVTVGSGSGGYNSTTGLITFSGASNLSVDGVFTSAYRNYRIIAYNMTGSTACGLLGRFRASGSTITSNIYYTAASYQLASGSSSFYSGFNGIGYTELIPVTSETGWSAFVWDVYQPQVSTTQTTSNFYGTGYSVAIQNRQGAIMFNSSQTVDGFHLYPNATSNLGGQIKVYGYN